MQDNTSWAVLALRLAAGLIFLSMGISKVFIIGIIPFAESTFVKGYAGTWLPEPLLWVAGVIDPLALLIGGALLILGLFTRWACIGLSAFMLMLVFGHMVMNPFDDLTARALPYFAMVLFVLYLAPKGNRFSLDSLIWS